MGAVPDDSAALITAAAVVRGEFGGPLVKTPAGVEESTRVPGGIVALRDVADCLVGNDTLPNRCGSPPTLSDADRATTTQFNRYPPLPFLRAGWPTLFLRGAGAYWGATIVAAIVNSLLLGLALWLPVTFVPRRLGVFGWLTVLTPQVLYLGGSINASGFEIAAATAGWSGLLVLAVTDDPPVRLIGWTVAAALMLMLARPVSPVWATLAVVVAAVTAGRERVKVLARRRSVRVGAGVLIAGGFVAVAWLLAVGRPTLLPLGPPPSSVSLLTAFRRAFAAEHGALVGQVGLFEIYYIPSFAWAIWFGLFGVVCVAGAALSPRRAMWCAISLAALIVIVPLIVGAFEYNHYGFPWQGKDGTPMSVGLPLLVAIWIPDGVLLSRVGRRLCRFSLICFTVCAIATFVFVLHRYTNGTDGSWTLTHFGWQPPGGVYLLTVAFILAALRVAVSIWRWSLPTEEPTRDLSCP